MPRCVYMYVCKDCVIMNMQTVELDVHSTQKIICKLINLSHQNKQATIIQHVLNGCLKFDIYPATRRLGTHWGGYLVSGV